MKDRSFTLSLAEGVQVLVRRSSAHPMEYAVMLRVFRDGRWHVIRTFDNAHAPHEHHEHRYRGDEKQQPPTITTGTPNEGMAAALDKVRQSWSTIVDSWERNL